MTYIKWAFRVIFVTFIAAFLHYTLPTWDVVRITNTEIQRMDFDDTNWIFWAGPDSGTAGSTVSRDVRLIYSQLANGREMVYRNEDTGFGWPPYFKVDSSNLQARASDYVSIRSDPDPEWVAVKHYGWRLTWFSTYPNALRIKEVSDPDATVTPWTSIIILVLLGFFSVAFYVRWRRFWNKRVDPAVETVVDRWESFDDDIEGRRNIFQRLWVWITGRRGA